MMLRALAILFLLLSLLPAQATDTGSIIATCGFPTQTYTAGAQGIITLDTSGKICINVGTVTVTGTVSATQGTSPWVVSGTVAVTQSTSPWVVSGTVAVTQSTSPWVVSVPTWAGGTLGAMANYGTSPGAVLVPGMNAFVTNIPAVTQSGTWNIGTLTTITNPVTAAVPTWAGGTLGAMANYGTSPGAVLVPGVNAFITNIPAVTQSGTWNIGTVTTLPAVTQGTSPWIVAGGGTAGTAASGVLTVQGIASMTKLLVTPDSVALPANQSVNVAQINAVTPLMGNGTTGTGSPRVTVASDNTPFPIKIDQTTPGTTNAFALAQIGATTVVNCGLAGCLSVGGATATNVAITDDPINTGAQAVSSENTAVTTARKVQLVADLVGKLIVLPYANPENFVSGVTAAMTGTTSTSLIAAPASGLRNYLTQLTCTNSHATVGTFVLVQDGSAGTTIYEAYAVAVGGGFAITFPTPLRQPTTATALYVQDVTTGANVICSGSGYKGA